MLLSPTSFKLHASFFLLVSGCGVPAGPAAVAPAAGQSSALTSPDAMGPSGEDGGAEGAARVQSTESETGGRLLSVACGDGAEPCGSAERHLELGRSHWANESAAFGAGGDGTRRAAAEFALAEEAAPAWEVPKFESARAKLGLGDGFAAQAMLARMSEDYPQDPEVLGTYGVALLSIGKVQQSVSPLRQAALLEPQEISRHLTLATALFLLGQYAEAERTYRAALALDAGSAQAQGDLGTLLVVVGRVREGKAHLQKALALAPSRATFVSNLAYTYFVEGDLKEAEKLARTATALDPGLPSGFLNLGLALAKQGRVDEAAVAFDAANTLDPDDPRVKNALADLAELQEKEASPQ